jgi:hypothetical protein
MKPGGYISVVQQRIERNIRSIHRGETSTMKNIRFAAVASALVLGVASFSPAMAYEKKGRYTGFLPPEVESTGTVYAAPQMRSPFNCPMSSAAEGNANQQNFPVQQYGQTSGGNRC